MDNILKNEGLNQNSDEKITQKELKRALDEGFFDNEKNIQLLVEELNSDGKYEALEKTFVSSLFWGLQTDTTGEVHDLILSLGLTEEIENFEIDIPDFFHTRMKALGIKEALVKDYYLEVKKSYPTLNDSKLDDYLKKLHSKFGEMKSINGQVDLDRDVHKDLMEMTQLFAVGGDVNSAFRAEAMIYDNAFFQNEIDKLYRQNVLTQEELVALNVDEQKHVNEIKRNNKAIKALMEENPSIWKDVGNTALRLSTSGLAQDPLRVKQERENIDVDVKRVLDERDKLLDDKSKIEEKIKEKANKVIENNKTIYLYQYKILSNNGARQEQLDELCIHAFFALGEEHMPNDMLTNFQQMKERSQSSKVISDMIKGEWKKAIESKVDEQNKPDEQCDALTRSQMSDVILLCEAYFQGEGKGKSNGEFVKIEHNIFEEANPSAINRKFYIHAKQNKDGTIDVQLTGTNYIGGISAYRGGEFTIDDDLRQKEQEREKELSLLINNNKSFQPLIDASKNLSKALEPIFLAKEMEDVNKSHSFARYVNKEAESGILHIVNAYKDVKGHVKEIQQQLKILQENKRTLFGGHDSELESQLNQHIDQLTVIQNKLASGKKLISKLNLLKNSASYSVDDFQHWLVTEGVVYVTAIGAAVVAITTLGSGSLVSMAMLGAAGGMAGQEIGQVISNYSGRKIYGENYDNRSLLHRYIDQQNGRKELGEEQVSFGKLSAHYGISFTRNFITTFALLGVGKLAGGWLSRFASNNATAGGFTGRAVSLINKIPRMQSSSHNLATKKGFSSRTKKFGREYIEELGQEGTENALQQINGPLGYIASIYFCLTPGKVNLSLGKTRDGKKLGIVQDGDGMKFESEDGLLAVTTFTYDSNYSTDLQNNMENTKVEMLSGYSQESSENGTIVYTKKITNKAGKETTHKIRFVGSNKSHVERQFVENEGKYFKEYGLQPSKELGGFDANALNPEGKKSLLKLLKDQGYIVTVKSNGNLKVIKNNESFTIRRQTEAKELKETQDSFVKELENSQNVEEQLDTENSIEVAETDAEKMSIIDKFRMSLIKGGLLSAKDDTEFVYILASNATKSLTHFLKEMWYLGSQTFDTYKSYRRFIQMKTEKEPGYKEAGKIALAKRKSWRTNFVKIVGVTAVYKMTIDPILFFGSGHLTADILAEHSKSVSNLLHASFETLQKKYHTKDNNKKIYDPKVVFDNGSLNETERRDAFIKELGLDAENSEHLELVEKLMEAHAVGKGQPGKDSRFSAGVYNYTNAQIKAKYELIKPYIDKGLITHQQVKKLFDLGYLGKNYAKSGKKGTDKVEFAQHAKSHTEREGSKETSKIIEHKNYDGVLHSLEQLYEQAGKTFNKDEFLKDIKHTIEVAPESELYKQGFRTITVKNNITWSGSNFKNIHITLTDSSGSDTELKLATQQERTTKEVGLELDTNFTYQQILEKVNLTPEQVKEAERFYEHATGKKAHIFRKSEHGYIVVGGEIAAIYAAIPNSADTDADLQKTKAKIGAFLKFVYKESAKADGFESSKLKLSKVDEEIVASYAKTKEKIKALAQKDSLSKKEKKVLEKLEKSLEMQRQVINSKVTLDTYVGIRSELKVSIEEQLYYLRKVLENSDVETISEYITIDDTLDYYLGRPKQPYRYKKSNTLKPEHPHFREGDDTYNEMMGNLVTYLDSFEGGTVLNEANTESLLWMCSEMVSQAEKANLLKEDSEGKKLTEEQRKEKIFGLVQRNMNSVLHQEVYNLSYLAGSDHGINHVVNGNMKTAISLMNKLGEDVTAKEKLMILQMITDHDIGYAHKLLDDGIIKNEDGTLDLVKIYFGQAKDHPLYSRIYIEEHADYYRSIYGKDFDIMKVAMLDHSKVSNTDLRKAAKHTDRGALLQNIISTVDCMGVSHTDKISPIFKETRVLDLLQKMQIISKSDEKTNKEKEAALAGLKKEMIEHIEESSDLSKNHKQLYIASLENTFDEQHPGFAVKYAFGSHCLEPIGVKVGKDKVTIQQRLNANMLGAVHTQLGQKVAFNNINKILEDYGIDDKNSGMMSEKRVTVNGEHYTLNQLEEVMLKAGTGATITIDAPHAKFEFVKEHNKELEPLVKQINTNGSVEANNLQSNDK